MDRDMIILAAVGVISLAGIISVFVLFFWSDHQRHKNKRKALSDRLNSLEGTLGELAGRQNLTTSERATLSTEQKAALKEYDDLQYENSELLDSTVDLFGPDSSKLKAKKTWKDAAPGDTSSDSAWFGALCRWYFGMEFSWTRRPSFDINFTSLICYCVADCNKIEKKS